MIHSSIPRFINSKVHIKPYLPGIFYNFFGNQTLFEFLHPLQLPSDKTFNTEGSILESANLRSLSTHILVQMWEGSIYKTECQLESLTTLYSDTIAYSTDEKHFPSLGSWHCTVLLRIRSVQTHASVWESKD